MTPLKPGESPAKPTPGAMRAAKVLSTLTLEPHTTDNATCPQCLRVAEVIDRETHAAELVEALTAAIPELCHSCRAGRPFTADGDHQGFYRCLAKTLRAALALAGRTE